MYLFIISTLLAFLSVHSSIISKFILQWCNRLTTKDKELLERNRILKEEQIQLSSVRDFVRYAKIQREINKITEELKESKNSRKTNSFIFNIGLDYSLKIIVGTLMVVLTLFYRKVPVFIVDTKYDLFPFGGIISFPNDYVNSISVHFWMMCCSSIAKMINLK